MTLVFAIVACTILLYFGTKEYDEGHAVHVSDIPYYVVQDQDSKDQTPSKSDDYIFPLPNLQFLYLTFRNDLWNDTLEEDQFWNGFVAEDAIIEDGAMIEKGAFVFPKAIIRANATGEISGMNFCEIGPLFDFTFFQVRSKAIIYFMAEIGFGSIIDANATIGFGAIIGQGAKVGNGTFIGHFATIGDEAKIGSGSYVDSKIDIKPYGLVKPESAIILINGRQEEFGTYGSFEIFGIKSILQVIRDVFVGSYFWLSNGTDYETFIYDFFKSI